MKFSAVLAAALAAGASAQRPGFAAPAWFQNGQYSSVTGRPTAFPFSTPGAVASSTVKAANPNIPAGSTVTESATAIPNVPTIVPTIPSATATATAITTGTASSSNSTSNSTIDCFADAKANPNQANSASHRCSWSNGFNVFTDSSSVWPNTGNVVKYTLTITNGTIAPQGDKKIGFLINGQNPGPKIEANWGDTLEITVVNKLQNNGTAVHWHGFQQKLQNPQDGVGGITECPLAPGDSKVYRFQATQYGTSWYHSHFSAQYGDGVLGPIVINGPSSANYDVDLGTVMLSDDYPLTAFQEEFMAKRFGPPTAINYLMNGQNVKVDGTAGQRQKWTFTPGKKHKLRIINSSTDGHFKVQLDQHSMIVVAMDLLPVQPYRTSELSIGIGQRFEIIVEANQTPGNYWFRALAAKDCTFNANDGTGNANGIIAYSNAPNSNLPSSQMTTSHSNACVDEPLSVLKPVVSKSVDSASFTSGVTSLGVGAGTVRTTNDTVFQWTIGGISQVIDWQNPTLLSVANGLSTFDTAKHVVTLPNANVWTYWVLQNQFFAPHPMHIHGHDFSILGAGVGTFNAASDSSKLNFVDPPRRDSVMLVSRGWTVVAFKTDNPGAWLMHCHIAWHVSGGLSLQFLERPSEIPAQYGATISGQSFSNTCANWKKYAAGMVYKQSDSGLRKREVVGDKVLDMEVMEELPERRGIEAVNNVVRRKVSHWGSQAQ